jgi:hypothetical protein
MMERGAGRGGAGRPPGAGSPPEAPASGSPGLAHPRTDIARVIGVDCATTEARLGLAMAERAPAGVPEDIGWILRDARPGNPAHPAAEVVAGWIRDSPGPVLLALDAPLGWPSPLRRGLAGHRAGARLPGEKNDLFRRTTDQHVASTLGKYPLEVGADRIARTAHWALAFLEELRERTGDPISMDWGTPPGSRISAIEVYPAATLLAWGASLRGYKAASGGGARQALLPWLEEAMDRSVGDAELVASADVLDAALCVATGILFLAGACLPPGDEALAREEGWIWFPSPLPSSPTAPHHS